MCAGVGKSGSPRISDVTDLPDACTRRTSARIELTAVGTSRLTRGAVAIIDLSLYHTRSASYNHLANRMSEPQRAADPPEGSPADIDERERSSRIEQLLLAGLDHYFDGHYEQAIDVWTRVA